MASVLDRFREVLRLNRRRDAIDAGAEAAPSSTPTPAIDIADDDPLLRYLAQAAGVVDVDGITLGPGVDSAALRALRAAGITLVVPLVNQGEVVAVVNLGPRRSEQDYSRDDRDLLNTLALQAAPAVRVAQMVREQQTEAIERERLQQEMNVARQIQFALLPKEDPNLHGYHLEKYYEPARAVGGDFYDFFELSDGQLVLIVADVSGKGVPAALVMANTRSVLRGTARRLGSPGEALARANDILCPEMPMSMFVTCLCAVLDPATGRMRYANAGHNPPYRHRAQDNGVDEMYARGMPLGLLPDRTYEEKEIVVAPGDCVLFYSDGLSEAHSPTDDMFGFDRMSALMKTVTSGSNTIEVMTQALRDFTGPNWEQEDDITMLVLERQRTEAEEIRDKTVELAHFTVPSVLGNERLVMARVAEAARPLNFTPERLEDLKTAAAEATMNAIEYGNRQDASLPVDIQVLRQNNTLIVRITDRGEGDVIPTIPQPNIEAKLAGEQSPRGWGLFLIKCLVDDLHFSRDPHTHHLTTELTMHLNTH